METQTLEARFDEFALPDSIGRSNATVAIPVSNGMQQGFYFLNLDRRKGLKVQFPHRPGLTTKDSWEFLTHLCDFVKNPEHRVLPRTRTFFRRYHNGISFFELLFKVSKPHGITHLGDQRFLVSLWSASVYFVIDLNRRTFERQMLDQKRDEVFSTFQYYVPETKETYFATQEGKDEWCKHDKEAIEFDVPVKIKKHNWQSGETSEVWSGLFDTDTHYIALDKDRRYLGLMQFGDFFDGDRLLPSKIMVLDLKDDKEWRIDNSGWSPSAHIDWDPERGGVCYLSDHQGVIVPVDSRIGFLFKKQYKWKIFGPAAVHRYEVNSHGPEKTGVFSHPDMIRMTIHKVFKHRSGKLLACTGFPNYIFVADADSMEFLRKTTISERDGTPSVVGSLHPSPDGEKVYLVTTRSFQIVDAATGRVDHIQDLGKIYDPFNHMISVDDTAW